MFSGWFAHARFFFDIMIHRRYVFSCKADEETMHIKFVYGRFRLIN